MNTWWKGEEEQDSQGKKGKGSQVVVKPICQFWDDDDGDIVLTIRVSTSVNLLAKQTAENTAAFKDVELSCICEWL